MMRVKMMLTMQVNMGKQVGELPETFLEREQGVKLFLGSVVIQIWVQLKY